jgi:hypothetical protein
MVAKRRGAGARGLWIGLAVLVAAPAAILLVSRDGPSVQPATEPPVEAAYRWQPEARPDPLTPLPAFATADPRVARLYRFALERPDVMSYIPCTCGCAQLGHRSNWNCFIQHVDADGTVVFDDMAPT